MWDFLFGIAILCFILSATAVMAAFAMAIVKDAFR